MAALRKPKKRTSRPKSGASRSKKTAPQKDTSAKKQTAGSDRFPIVGIGASAGGLAALRALIEVVPDEPGVAFVVIQHLDPTKKSLTPDLLASYTKMQVTQVADEPRLEPNRVYVIPPNKYLSISDGKLHLSEPLQPRGSRMAIDFFLRSLAKDQAHRAVGVILSGTGTDGTLGVKAIKADGGLVIAQDPETAEHGGMPRSAIESGVVDSVLPPEEIPKVLVRYAQHPYVREDAGGPPPELAAREEGQSHAPPSDGLQGINGLLRAHGKHDFRSYKDNTLIRRTRRRMCLHHLDDYGQYCEYLREHPQEIDALIKDLLISVTDFFRDAGPWEELAELAIKPIVQEKNVDDPVRVWVPGCATGEEAYSVAMLVLEELHRQEKPCPLQVFASDIDKSALDYARTGRYPRTIEADVSPQRLKRFFVHSKEDPNYYRISKILREAVVFADQNLIADPPFSKLDLICCRNLLIYLKPEMQDKVLRLFHFALRRDGYLFLGTSETIGRRGELFATVSRESRIYRRKGPTRHEIVDIPLAADSKRREIEPPPPAGERHQTRLNQITGQQLLDMLAPRAVVVNRQREILQICGDVDPYLKLAPGVPTNDVLALARHGLRTRLRGTIHKVFADNEPVRTAARVQREGVYHAVHLDVRPLHDPDQEQDLALVLFTEEQQGEVRESEAPAEPQGAANKQGSVRQEPPTTRAPATRAPQEADIDDHAVIRQLETELLATQEDLQTTVEQYETSNEEYKAANEEVMSMNEELQSTNEELETSKEELQSLNEELATVNSQLASKVEQLEIKHDDLANLLQVTHLASVCLDDKLKVRWFSSQAAELIRVTGADVGRPISDFAHAFLNGDIDEVARHVLDRLTPEEREVAAKDGRWFLRRTTPYRTEDGRIGGVVITFIDITERKQAEEALRESHALAEKIIDTIREATLVLDNELRVVQANESFYRTFQVSHHETDGRLVYELGNNQWDIPELRLLLEKVLPENKTFSDFEVDHEFDSIGRRVMLLNGRQIDHIHLILLAIEDITELRLAEHRRGFLLDLTDAFRRANDPQSILNEAVLQLCTFLNCSRTLMLRVAGTDKEMRKIRTTILTQHSTDLDDLPEQFPLADFGPDALTVLKGNDEVVVEDVLQDRRFKGSSATVLTEMDIRSLIAVPRLNGDRVESLLLVTRPNRRKWNREEVALIREVSERTWSALEAARAQRALCESEARYRELFDQSPLSLWEEDLSEVKTQLDALRAQGVSDFHSYFSENPDVVTRCMSRVKLLSTNQASLRMFETDSQDVLLDSLDQIIAEESWPVVGELLADLTEGQDHFRGEQLVKTIAGNRRDIIVDFSITPGHRKSWDHCIVSLTDITRRKQAERELQHLNDTLEQQVSQRTDMLKLLQDVTRSANEARTVEEAMHAALGRIAQYNGWQVGHVWWVADGGSGELVDSGIWYLSEQAGEAIGRLDEFQRTCEQARFSPGQGMVGRVIESGEPQWVDDIQRSDDWWRAGGQDFGLHAAIAFPVTVNAEKVAVLEFFSDHPARREERFMEIMPDVGIQLGHVIERKRLEFEIAEATAEQQRVLGRELHDSVSQHLTGVGMIAETLRVNLKNAGSLLVGDASTLVEHVQEAHDQVRRLSRGLMPVDVDAEALMAALEELAESVSSTHKLDCTFCCPRRTTVEDNNTATHLYRIAQEAVQNAVKHGQPTQIEIGLERNNDHVTMTVCDNGGGFQDSVKSSRGTGHRIMQYRADLIGAELDIESKSGQGVTVRCRVKRSR